MSGTKDKPVEHDAPSVHVDTIEQAAARQWIETSARVTHVAPPEPEPQEHEDFSLAVLVRPVVVVKKGDKQPDTKAGTSSQHASGGGKEKS